MIKIFFNDEQVIEYLKRQGYTVQKKEIVEKNIEKARESRSKKIQEKIQKTIEEMKTNNEPINANSLSKRAKINYRTAKKFWKKIAGERGFASFTPVQHG